jgi:hypothetical protein
MSKKYPILSGSIKIDEGGIWQQGQATKMDDFESKVSTST